MKETRGALMTKLGERRNSRSIKKIAFQKHISNHSREDVALRKQEIVLHKEIAQRMQESEKQFKDSITSMVSHMTQNMNQGLPINQQMMQQNSSSGFHQAGVYNWNQQQMQEKQRQTIARNSNSTLYYEEL